MIGQLLVGFVAVIHIVIVVAEMVFWQTGPVRRAFGVSEEFAMNTRVMAANQGLYNAFLVAGLVWAMVAGLPGAGAPIAHFFLACIMVAGLYGAATASRRILFVQTLPAGAALVAVLAGV